MRSIFKSAFLLILLCSCCKKETEELCPRFLNSTLGTLNIITYVKSNGSTEKVAPNSLSSLWMIPYTLDILEGINLLRDSISVYDDDSHLICKFTKTATFNYRGNPFIDRDKWVYQGINRIKRRSQSITYVNLHEYWFRIEYDSIIVHK